ncbi:MAG: hypothetical protein BGP07_10210 [Rhizobiales bacterium 63-22]|nr:MAG: hypothetical protein BGP07_10210 [Rhizobiales bacterium 63-22]
MQGSFGPSIILADPAGDLIDMAFVFTAIDGAHLRDGGTGLHQDSGMTDRHITGELPRLRLLGGDHRHHLLLPGIGDHRQTRGQIGIKRKSRAASAALAIPSALDSISHREQNRNISGIWRA